MCGMEVLEVQMLDEYKDVLTVQEVSDVLKISKQLVRKLIKNRELTGLRIGREYRVLKKDLISYICPTNYE